MWKITGNDKPAAAKLIKILDKPHGFQVSRIPSAQQRAAEALAEIGKDAASAEPSLRKLSGSKRTEDRLAAAKALWTITGDHQTAVRESMKIISSQSKTRKDKELKLQAVQLLGQIGPYAKEALPLLRSLIDELEPVDRYPGINVTILYRDEEDRPEEEIGVQIRKAAIKAVEQIDNDSK